MAAHWKELYRRPSDTVAQAIETLDRGISHICLVVDERERLLGTITDGDIRRGLLRSIPFDAPVSEIMKVQPVVGRPDQSSGELRRIMQARQVRQLPLIDNEGRIVGLYVYDELFGTNRPSRRANPVVLMAGGSGTRLRPLTDDVPKPLLKVGNKPLLERILESFVEYDFHNFIISVNYKADMIKAHFGDGTNWDVDIRYLDESDRLGTAGALSMIDSKGDLPIIVMNGDVFTQLNIESLLAFHAEQATQATMCVRSYDLQIPYGVVRTQNMRIVGIDEKPEYRFFVNAGIYVLEPSTLSFVPKNSFFDMPDLFQALIESGHETTVFPIREYWMDIGKLDDYQRANDDASKLFS
jgi:dTDP-glucose pyrophosphorylase